MVSFRYLCAINIPQSTYVSVQRTRTVSAERGRNLRFPSAEHGSFLRLIQVSPDSLRPGNVSRTPILPPFHRKYTPSAPLKTRA
jgi:hypothetical protein